jgi:hypothetical protein
LIFNIVVPVSDGIKNVRQYREQRQQPSPPPGPTTAPKKETPKEEEYIDFEEVK